MADNQGDTKVEGQTQPVATPATDQKLPTEASTQMSTPKGDTTGENSADELGLPEGASDRTRQRVQELLDENKRLKEAQVPVPEPVYPAPVMPSSYAVPRTDEYGNVNPAYVELLEQRQVATEQTMVRNSVREEAREAESAHPELKTDKAFLGIARGIKTDSLLYPEMYGGRELSLKEAADLAKRRTGEPKKDADVPSQEKIDASSGVEGRPGQGVQRELTAEDREGLVWETRRGNTDAAIARMKNIPAVNSKG